MFRRAFRTPPSHDRRWLKRLGPVGLALALVAAPLALLPSFAEATLGGGSPYNAANGVIDANVGDPLPDFPTGATDNAYSGSGGGAKENTLCPSVETGSIPNNKADLTNFWVDTDKGTTDTFLYLAWERASTNGTVTLDFELNQSGEITAVCNGVNPTRVAGDKLVTYDLQGNHGAETVVISVRTWDGTEWGDPSTLSSAAAEGSISQNLLFGEMAIDLELAGIFTAGQCENFATVFLKSRSSSAFTAELKDFIAPVPKQVSNCGSLQVTKTVVGGATGDSFNFTVDCGAVDVNGAAAGTDATFSLVNGGSNTIDEIALGSSCSVTETDPGATLWTTTYKVDGGTSVSGRTASSLVIALGTRVVAFTNTRITGSLTIEKTTSGGTGTFSFDINCSVDSFDRSNVSAGPGAPYVLSGIPTGTTCTVTEDTNGDFTQTLVVPEDGTVTIDANGETVAFTNTRNVGSLTITKAANAAGSFTFDINCSVDSFDRSNVSAGPGAPYVLSGIPTGTTCTVTEDTNGDFTQTLVVPEDGTVTIDANGETVAFTNTRNVGSLTITKAADAAGSFTFDINCSVDSFDRSNVSAGPGAPYVLSGIPTGTSCVVTEDANGDFTQTSVIPADGTVVIGGTGPQTVAFVNTRKVGSLTISKTADAPGTFMFNVDCSDNTFDQVITIQNSGSGHVDGIPTGTSCTVTERDNPLFSSVVIPESGTVVITTQGQTVAFTNTRITGPLTITKTAIGGTGTFTFDVDCSDNAFDQVVTIEGSGSETITGIPTTTSCTVTERSNSLFTTSVLPLNGAVSIDAGGENVGFVNTAKPNGLTVDKKVNGGDHATTEDALLAHNADALTYTVVITNNGQVPLTITAMSDSLYPSLVIACPQAVGSLLAAGASFTCTYKVGANGDAHNVVSVSAIDGLERPLTASDGTYVDVISPGITILKTANPVSISVSGPVTYSYVVTNTGDAVLHDVVVNDDIIGLIGTIGTLNPGETRTLTRTVDVDINTPRTNIGTVSGTDVLGGKVTANDKETITVVLGEVLVQPAATPPAVLPLVELPRTGAPLGTQGRVGIILLQAGLVLWYFGRRRRQVGPLAG